MYALTDSVSLAVRALRSESNRMINRIESGDPDDLRIILIEKARMYGDAADHLENLMKYISG